MKRINKNSKYLFLFALFISFSSFSQEFAPIGAIWHYGVSESPVSSPDQGYLTFESIRDTAIQGHNCRIIKKTRYYYQGQPVDEGIEVFYQENNKDYHLINNSFYTLYNFNATTGDS